MNTHNQLTEGPIIKQLVAFFLPIAAGTLLLAEKNGQVSYVLCANGLKLDMADLIPAVNLALGGKGGGRGTLAQGSAPTPAGLPETVEQLRTYLRNVLKA